MEEDLLQIYEGDGGGLISQFTKEVLTRLEGRKNTLLCEKEESWRLKSRALWLECGDNNTKNFHAFAKGRKAVNTIWSLRDEDGNTRSILRIRLDVGLLTFEICFGLQIRLL